MTLKAVSVISLSDEARFKIMKKKKANKNISLRIKAEQQTAEICNCLQARSTCLPKFGAMKHEWIMACDNTRYCAKIYGDK